MLTIGQTTTKNVTAYYGTKAVEVVETIRVTRLDAFGSKRVLWAVGEVIATTDPTGHGVGIEKLIAPVVALANA